MNIYCSDHDAVKLKIEIKPIRCADGDTEILDFFSTLDIKDLYHKLVKCLSTISFP